MLSDRVQLGPYLRLRLQEEAVLGPQARCLPNGQIGQGLQTEMETPESSLLWLSLGNQGPDFTED